MHVIVVLSTALILSAQWHRSSDETPNIYTGNEEAVSLSSRLEQVGERRNQYKTSLKSYSELKIWMWMENIEKRSICMLVYHSTFHGPRK